MTFENIVNSKVVIAIWELNKYSTMQWILKFLAFAVLKLLSKNYGGLQKPFRWGIDILKNLSIIVLKKI